MIRVIKRQSSIVKNIPKRDGQINTRIECYGNERSLLWIPGFLGTMPRIINIYLNNIV